MTVVKRLVKTGITICATIHSPTPYGAALLVIYHISMLLKRCVTMAERFAL